MLHESSPLGGEGRVRGVEPALLRRLVVGVLARGVVGAVDDLVDALDGVEDRGFDALL